MARGKVDLSQFNFHIEFHPRFSDLDAFGHVNNARIFTYFEEARVAYLKHLGIFLPHVSPISIVIQRAECSFLAPIMHHHLVQVFIRSQRWGVRSFDFSYAVWLPEEDLLAATGSTRAVSYDLSKRRSAPIPPEYLERMKGFEGQ